MTRPRLPAIAFLIGALAPLLAPWLAQADTLVYVDGSRVNGNVRDVTFLADGVPGIYPRDIIESLHITEEGKDEVALDGAGVRKGALVSVRFRAAAGILNVPRKLIKAIELSADSVVLPAPKPRRKEPAAKDTPKSQAEEHKPSQKLVYRNLSIRNRFWDKASDIKKEEVRQLKAEYMDRCTKAVQDIRRINETIRKKEDKRKDRMRQWQREQRKEDQKRLKGQRARKITKPKFNDGMERDQQALRKAFDAKRKLQRIIRKEMGVLSKRTSERRRRVEAAYSRQKRVIAAGEKLTVEQMVERYTAALDLGGGGKGEGASRKKDAGKKKQKGRK